MLIYDDIAAGALAAADDEARGHGSNGYGTEHVLLGLLRTGDPVTRRVTDEAPQLTAETVRAALIAPPRPPRCCGRSASIPATSAPSCRRAGVPATMVPGAGPVPAWPAPPGTATGPGRLARLLGRRGRG